MENNEEGSLKVKTPLWSVEASGRTVMTILAVLAILAAIFWHNFAEAQRADQQEQEARTYRHEVVEHLKAITWILAQPESKKQEIATKLQVPPAILSDQR